MGLWDAVLRDNLITMQAYFKEQERNQINNLILHRKQVEKRTKNSKI